MKETLYYSNKLNIFVIKRNDIFITYTFAKWPTRNVYVLDAYQKFSHDNLTYIGVL